MKRRVVPKNKARPFRPYQIALIGFVVTLGALVVVLMIKQEFSLGNKMDPIFKALLYLNLICLFTFVVLDLTRAKVPWFKVEKMNLRSRLTAQMIKSKFNDNTLIYKLKISNETPFGYELPAVRVFINEKLDEGYVALENMGNTLSTLSSENMLDSLSGLLVGHFLRKYSFVSSELSRDGNYYLYYFEDTTTPQRFVVKNNDLVPFVSTNPNILKLAKNLSWQVNGSTPHLGIIGRTRSGKSYFVGEYLLPLMKKQGWEVEFFSVKNDIYVDKYDGEYLPEKIVARLEHWATVMEARNKTIKKVGKSKYTEISGMANICLCIDEIGNLNGSLSLNRKLKARWESVIGKLTATGASAGIHVVAISQYGTKEGFLPSTARANVSNAVIMLGLAADNATDRQYMLSGFDLPHRNYATGQGIARIVSAGRKWEKPHFYETPLFIK